jgi:hypothetical protein
MIEINNGESGGPNVTNLETCAVVMYIRSVAWALSGPMLVLIAKRLL